MNALYLPAVLVLLSILPLNRAAAGTTQAELTAMSEALRPDYTSLTREGIRRAQQRLIRLKVSVDYTQAHKDILDRYIDALLGTIDWSIEQKLKTEAAELLKLLKQLSPDFIEIKSLEARIKALPVPSASTSDELYKEYLKKLEGPRRTFTSACLDLANRCWNAGLVGNAYDLIWVILAVDPEHAIARNAAGHVKVKDRWVTRWHALQQQQGLYYLENYGWVPQPAIERIKQGEWYEKGQWLPMADADKKHASLQDPWAIETEHFLLKSTMSRVKALEIAERLHEIRDLVYREYLPFFMRSSGRQGTQLLFNQAAQKKMVVYYLASQEDFEAIVRRDIPQRMDIAFNSSGFYTSRTGASYFYYHGPRMEAFMIPLMQHEVTHQILGEFARGGDPQTWMLEGVAEVLEYARPGKFGRLESPKGRTHPNVKAAAKLLKDGFFTSTSQIRDLSHEDFHREPERSHHYQLSGAFCRFLLEWKSGIYAIDFLEFLNDCYRSQMKPNLNDYLGVTNATLDRAFLTYLQNKDD